MSVQHDFGRLDFDSHKANAFPLRLLSERRPPPNPVDDRFVVGGVDTEPLSAAMTDTHGRFQQQLAMLGLLEIDARVFRALRFGTEDLVRSPFDDPLVVFPRVQRIGRQLEATLALHAAMAIAGVTAPLGQNRSNVTSKAERSLLAGSGDRQPGFGRLSI